MLKKQYDEKLAQKEELHKKSEEMEVKLERAGMLVSGLAGEKARWEETVKVRSLHHLAVLLPCPPVPRAPVPFRLRDRRGKWGYLGEGTSKNGAWEFFPSTS